MSTRQELYTWLTERISPLTWKEKLIFIFLCGFFVFLFLLFFQPFGVNNYDPKETITSQFFWIMLTMGMVISLIIGVNEFGIYRLFFRREPTRYAIIIWILWSIVWLSSGIFLFYNFLGNWHDFLLASYFEFIGNIGSMTILPIAGILVYVRIRDLKTTLNKKEIQLFGSDEGEELLSFIAENHKDQFSCPLKYLIYIESQDNYIAIYYLKDKALSKILLRKSLKSLQEELTHPALMRCHRSYMVNLKHIREVRGNRKKLMLRLENAIQPIPVSRQYVNEIYELVTN